jgi:hypothetical protein
MPPQWRWTLRLRMMRGSGKLWIVLEEPKVLDGLDRLLNSALVILQSCKLPSFLGGPSAR